MGQVELGATTSGRVEPLRVCPFRGGDRVGGLLFRLRRHGDRHLGVAHAGDGLDQRGGGGQLGRQSISFVVPAHRPVPFGVGGSNGRVRLRCGRRGVFPLASEGVATGGDPDVLGDRLGVATTERSEAEVPVEGDHRCRPDVRPDVRRDVVGVDRHGGEHPRDDLSDRIGVIGVFGHDDREQVSERPVDAGSDTDEQFAVAGHQPVGSDLGGEDAGCLERGFEASAFDRGEIVGEVHQLRERR